MTTCPSDWTTLHKQVARHGYAIMVGRKHNFIVRPPQQARLVTFPKSASDHRAIRNTWQEFKRLLRDDEAAGRRTV